ncbi:MAG: helix-turn-helix domain-containing protein [Xenococcaceae cyanobacterium]
MSNIIVSIEDEQKTKTLLIKCLKAAGFKVTNTEKGIFNVYLHPKKISPPEETKPTNTHTQESIFPSLPRLHEVFEFIELNYQHSIKLKEVAKAVAYSPAYLTDLVRRKTGKTVNDWIIVRRLEEAKRLLLETDDSIEQIAFDVGYQNINHFYCQFRNYCQNTPSAWREAQRCKQY